MAKKAAYQIAIELGAKLDKNFGKTMDSASGKLGALGKVGKGIGKAGIAIATAAVTAAVAVGGLAVKGVQQAAALEKQMADVGTLLDGTGQQIKTRLAGYQSDILKISNATGIVTSDLVEGLSEVIGALEETEDSMDIAAIAAKAAKAGNASTAESVKLLTSVTKGYGDISKEAQQRVADLAFETVRIGVTSIPELAASMGSVIPVAATMKVGQEELFGAMAALTGVTGSTSEVTTQLGGVIQGFLKPTANMTKAMKKAGYANGQVMLETLGLQGTLEALKDTVKGDEIAFANLFGRSTAMTAALALTGAQAESFASSTQAMNEAAGATDRAFEIQTDNLQDRLAKLKNMGTNALTQLGTAILPHVSKAVERIMPLVEGAIEQLPGVIEKVSSVIGPMFDKLFSVGESLLPVLGDTLMSLAEAGTPLFETLVGVIGELAPVLADAARQLAPLIVSAGELLRGIIEPLLPLLASLVSAILPPLIAIVQAVMQVLEPIIPVLLSIITAILPPLEMLLGAVGTMLTALGPLFSFVGEIIGGAFTVAFAVIGPILEFFIGLITMVVDAITYLANNWEEIWTNVGNFFKGVWDGIVNIFKSVINFFIRGINTFIGGLNMLKIPDWVPGIGGFSLNIPLIPELAKGTDFFDGGLALVGERGPELVNMPRGSQVTPAQKTEELLSSQGGGFGIQYSPNIVIQGNADKETVKEALDESIDELERKIEEILRRKQRVSFA